MTDRELLELAAKAAGLPYIKPADDYDGSLGLEVGDNPMRTRSWEPLTGDGDSLRLAVKLRLDVLVDTHAVTAMTPSGDSATEDAESISDPYAATRRVIVRAAAEIGRAME